MLDQDIGRLSDPNFIPDGSNTVYCIFMIIGIIGYFCVPTVASWIIQSGGAGALGQKVNSAAMGTGAVVMGAAGMAAGSLAGKVKNGYEFLKNSETPPPGTPNPYLGPFKEPDENQNT